MNPPKLERRRRVVVDRDLQVRLVARIAAAFLGSLVLFVMINLGAPVVLGALAGVPDWGSGAFVFRLRFLAAFVALPMLSAVLVLFAVGVRATFGVAGPLYRFREVFRDLAALRIPRGVRIRRNDTLQRTAAKFDAALVALHDHVERVQARTITAIAELEARIEADPELAAPLRELRARLAALDEETSRLRLLPCAPYPESAAGEPVEPAPSEQPAATEQALR